jgi:hypothetical protein
MAVKVLGTVKEEVILYTTTVSSNTVDILGDVATEDPQIRCELNKK